MFSIKDWVETVHEYYGQFQTSPYHLLQMTGLLLILAGVFIFGVVVSGGVAHKRTGGAAGIIVFVAGVALLVAPPVDPQTGISAEQPPTFGKMVEEKTGTSQLECTVLVTNNGGNRIPPQQQSKPFPWTRSTCPSRRNCPAPSPQRMGTTMRKAAWSSTQARPR